MIDVKNIAQSFPEETQKITEKPLFKKSSGQLDGGGSVENLDKRAKAFLDFVKQAR